MKAHPQLSLLDLGEKPRKVCPTCAGKMMANRCHPCSNVTPEPGKPAWKRWTRRMSKVVLARCEAAGFGSLACATWSALMDNRPLPTQTAGLVADIAAHPITPERYFRALDVAVTRSQLETHLKRQGFQNGEEGGWVADNIAGRAAVLIWEQRDRVAAGEVFERHHDAELVEQAIREHEARVALRARGLRGANLEQAVRARVDAEMVSVWGTYGRPRDEYPRAGRIDVDALRVVGPTVRVDDGAAEEEAAEVETAAAEGRAA